MKTLIRLFKDEEGSTVIEYGLIAALVSIAAIAGMTAMGTKLQTVFTAVSSDLR